MLAHGSRLLGVPRDIIERGGFSFADSIGEKDNPSYGPRAGSDALVTGITDAGRTAMTMAGIVTRLRAESTTTGAKITLDHEGNVYRRVFYLPEPFRVSTAPKRAGSGGSAS